MIALGQVITGVAKLREESRGTHYRSDFPQRDDEHGIRQILATCKPTGPKLSVVPIPIPKEIEDGLRSGRLKMD